MEFSTDQVATLLVGGFIAIIALYAYHYAMRKRDTVIYKVKLMSLALVMYFLGAVFLSQRGYPPSTVLLGAILIGLSAKFIVKRPSSSRYIPRHIKRAVIERDLPEGEEYDSRRHHLDHTVAYSKGGDTSVRNLRLIDRTRNLRKGAKRPQLRDFL